MKRTLSIEEFIYDYANDKCSLSWLPCPPWLVCSEQKYWTSSIIISVWGRAFYIWNMNEAVVKASRHTSDAFVNAVLLCDTNVDKCAFSMMIIVMAHTCGTRWITTGITDRGQFDMVQVYTSPKPCRTLQVYVLPFYRNLDKGYHMDDMDISISFCS